MLETFVDRVEFVGGPLDGLQQRVAVLAHNLNEFAAIPISCELIGELPSVSPNGSAPDPDASSGSQESAAGGSQKSAGSSEPSSCSKTSDSHASVNSKSGTGFPENDSVAKNSHPPEHRGLPPSSIAVYELLSSMERVQYQFLGPALPGDFGWSAESF